jgi:hypothetical protein
MWWQAMMEQNKSISRAGSIIGCSSGRILKMIIKRDCIWLLHADYSTVKKMISGANYETLSVGDEPVRRLTQFKVFFDYSFG